MSPVPTSDLCDLVVAETLFLLCPLLPEVFSRYLVFRDSLFFMVLGPVRNFINLRINWVILLGKGSLFFFFISPAAGGLYSFRCVLGNLVSGLITYNLRAKFNPISYRQMPSLPKSSH